MLSVFLQRYNSIVFSDTRVSRQNAILSPNVQEIEVDLMYVDLLKGK